MGLMLWTVGKALDQLGPQWGDFVPLSTKIFPQPPWGPRHLQAAGLDGFQQKRGFVRK